MEALEIQKLKTYDEQYFENLRAFKKSDHEISYAYYEAWSPIEGVTGYKDPASWGERMVGLPDSIDIVNLWMGIPTAETHPIAYADMQYCQRKLGTRFLSCMPMLLITDTSLPLMGLIMILARIRTMKRWLHMQNGL